MGIIFEDRKLFKNILLHVLDSSNENAAKPTKNIQSRRRRAETEVLTPAQALTDAYYKRKTASARFPLKISLQIQ